jgi:drug/metabolite transporter (DMT)-like permease
LKSRNIAFFFAFSASIIYGVSFTIAKDVMPKYILPFGFILLRVTGATILFWMISFFIPKEKIALKDYKKLFFAAFFGVALNMLTFFKGLSLTTPINGSVIMTTSPVLVMLFSFVFLKDQVTLKKILGILLGMTGAVILIKYGAKSQTNAPNIPWGNILVFINAASYAMYLIVVKPVLQKYHPFHAIKWIYLMGLFMVLPFGITQVLQAPWVEIPQVGLLKIGFIVVFTTFITYLFNLLALRNLKPTTLSVFIYLQPLFASIFAIMMGSDYLDYIKVVSTILIFTGVYLVSHRKAKSV